MPRAFISLSLMSLVACLLLGHPLAAQELVATKSVELLPVDSVKLVSPPDYVEEAKKNMLAQLSKALQTPDRYKLIQPSDQIGTNGAGPVAAAGSLDPGLPKIEAQTVSDYSILLRLTKLEQNLVNEQTILHAVIEIELSSTTSVRLNVPQNVTQNQSLILRSQQSFDQVIQGTPVAAFLEGFATIVPALRQDLSRFALFFRFAEIANLRANETILDVGQYADVQVGDQFDVFDANSLSNQLASQKKARVAVVAVRNSFAVVHILSLNRALAAGDQAVRVDVFGLEIGLANTYYLQQNAPGGAKITEDRTYTNTDGTSRTLLASQRTVPFDLAVHISLNKWVYYVRPYLQIGLILNTDWYFEDLDPAYQVYFAALGLEYRLNLGIFNISPRVDLALVTIDPAADQLLFVAGGIVRSKINVSVLMFEAFRFWLEAGYQIGFGEHFQGFISNSLGFGLSLQ